MIIDVNGYSKAQIQKNLETVLRLEWLGIHIEDAREERDKYRSRTVYYLSVPECSTMNIDKNDALYNRRVKTSNELINYAKEELTNMIIDSCENVYGNSDGLIDDIREHQSNYIKFYVKIRADEVWTKELGDKRLANITEELKKDSGYKEV